MKDVGRKRSEREHPYAREDPVLRESERYGRRPDDGDDIKAHEGPVEKPNYGLSGALARDTNTTSGVVLKYTEPLEARPPALRYRLYVFKGSEQLDVLHIHRQSSYLIGRERSVADIQADHPSLSKQHAVIQYRQILVPDSLGLADTKEVKPYIIDLDSANGTFVNNERIPATRFYELKLGDALKFGYSTREYVFMAEEMSLLDDGKGKEKHKKTKSSRKS